jgi:hypothetical protein
VNSNRASCNDLEVCCCSSFCNVLYFLFLEDLCFDRLLDARFIAFDLSCGVSAICSPMFLLGQ